MLFCDDPSLYGYPVLPALPPMPTVLSRVAWGAKAPNVALMHRHRIRFITIHHTGTPQKPLMLLERKLANLQLFSQREDKLASGKTKPAWGDVPYHFYISTDGRIGVGRPLEWAGDTNTEYDPTGHALIVIEGMLDTEPFFEAQKKSLYELVLFLAARYEVPPRRIKGHQDYAETDCPGSKAMEELPRLRRAVANRRS
ncbi:MAG: N-acetylmuramoyl-L-alanine amidase [Fimbriimonadaceae bacterium]|nr:N-acetylmuramoyl-L-alanine amidase [Fimbriimonadaceae bacterium]